MFVSLEISVSLLHSFVGSSLRKLELCFVSVEV